MTFFQPWALKNLPPFRPVAVKLLRLTSQNDVRLSSIESVLRTDAAFSAEVLRLANSALMDSRTEVVSVAHAVGMLGLDRLKALSLTIAMRDFISCSHGESMRLFWQYNLASAATCEWLAGFIGIQPDEGYTAGLIHDIGRLALLRSFPKEYDRMMEAIGGYEFDLLRCEKDLFDIDHCEAGRYLLDRWQFPDTLRDAAALHHQRPGPQTPRLVSLVHAGWQIADMLGYSPFDLRSAATIEEITATLHETSRQRIFAGLAMLPEFVEQRLKAAEPVNV